MKTFECSQCGACCRAVNCKHLDGNTCTIYETRPLVCRIDEGYEAHFVKIMSREQWHRLSADACKQLQERETSSQTAILPK